MMLALIWYPFETVALTALSNLCGPGYSLTDVTLESSTLSHQVFCLDDSSNTRIQAVFSPCGGPSVSSPTNVLATYCVTVCLGADLVPAPKVRALGASQELSRVILRPILIVQRTINVKRSCASHNDLRLSRSSLDMNSCRTKMPQPATGSKLAVARLCCGAVWILVPTAKANSAAPHLPPGTSPVREFVQSSVPTRRTFPLGRGPGLAISAPRLSATDGLDRSFHLREEQ
jgi:hypothetical protein